LHSPAHWWFWLLVAAVKPLHFFHPIDTTLLPAEADRQTWWVIFDNERASGYTVYRIQVRQESAVTENFPDIG
jgi:hypothetical protein